MVRRDGAEIRKEQIQEIAKLIQRSLHNHGEISLSKTIATLQYETGLTKEKLMEYLGILEGLGQFVVEKEQDKIKRISEDHERGF